MDLKELLANADTALAAYREHSKAGETDAAERAYADFEAARGKADALIADREKAQKADAAETWIAQQKSTSAGMLPIGTPPVAPVGEEPTPSVKVKAGPGKFETYQPSGTARFKAASEAEYTGHFRDWLATGRMSERGRQLAEQKALSVGVDAGGGFLVASEVLYSGLIQALGNDVLMRRIGTVLPPLTSATSIRVPSQESELDAAEWTVEAGTGTADTATPFGSRSLTPHPLVKLVRVSNTLLRLSSIDVEAWLRDQIGYKFAIAEENCFLNGTGAAQPLGVFVDTNATLTAADVTCTSATDIDYDDLLAVEFALKAQYRAGASWIFHRTILKELHQLVDGVGLPLLRRDPIAPATFNLFGYPIHESEYAPSSSASTLYVGALGNWKRAYWIVDTLNLTTQRLVELYAESNQTGFMSRKETDGMIVDPNGIIRLKMNT